MIILDFNQVLSIYKGSIEYFEISLYLYFDKCF